MEMLDGLVEGNHVKKNNVKDYKMKEGNYIVKVRVLEGSDLRPIEWNGSIQSFVVIKIFDGVQKTRVVKDTMSPLFDESMVFEFEFLDKGKLEAAKITIEVWDWNLIFPSELIGSHEIDLSTVYYQPDHQFYRTWFTLIDTTDEREGVLGYVNATIDVLGPDDEPVVREQITSEETEQTVVSQKLKGRGHLIVAEIFRGEHIVPFNLMSKKNSNFVRVNYGGSKIQSNSHQNDSTNPEWNELLFLQATFPNHSKNVQIELYNQSSMGEELIGTGLVPINLFKFIDDLEPSWINIYGPPLVGTGPAAREMALFGAKRGSCYRGRLLMRFSSRDHDDPKNYSMKMITKLPQVALPTPPSKTYNLRIDVFNGQALPGDQGLLHFVLGPYLLKTKKVFKEDGVMNWEESFEIDRVRLPVDPQMLPDLIIYFCDLDYESHRKCFLRVPARQILCRKRRKYDKGEYRSIVAKLKEDSTMDLVEDDQFSGFLTVRPILFAIPSPPKFEFQRLHKDKTEYELKVFLLVGRDLPSASKSNVSNPFVVVTCCGKVLTSKTKRSTLNPEFHQVLSTTIKIPNLDSVEAPTPTLIVMVYHSASGDDFTSNDIQNGTMDKILLGRYWLDLDVNSKKQFKLNKGSVDIIYKQAKWVPIIYDKLDQVNGRLLMSYALIPIKNKKAIDDFLLQKKIKHDEVVVNRRTFQVRMFMVGIRNIIEYIGLRQKPKWCSVEIRISLPSKQKVGIDKQAVAGNLFEQDPMAKRGPSEAGGDTDENVVVTTPQMEDNGDIHMGIKTAKQAIVNFSVDIKRTFTFNVDAPYNKSICPVLEVFFYYYPFGKKELLGSGIYPLEKALGFFYGLEDDRTYQKKWRDFFRVTVSDQSLGAKKKPPKFKVPRITPINQILYLDEMVYELPKQVQSKKRQKRTIWKKENHLQYIINKLEVERKRIYKAYRGKRQIDIQEYSKSKAIILDNDDVEKLSDDEIIELQNKFPFLEIDRDAEYQRNELARIIKDKYEQDRASAKISQKMMKSNLGSRLGEKYNNINKSNNQGNLFHKMMAGQDYKAALLDNSLAGDSDRESDLEVNDFNLKDDDEIEELSADVSSKALAYDNLFVTEKRESQKNRIASELKYQKKGLFSLKFGILGSAFSWFKGDDIEEYIDFDTDTEEKIETVPEYLQGRPEYQDDLEDVMMEEGTYSKVIETINFQRGNNRGRGVEGPKKQDVGHLKCLFLREDKKNLIPIPKIKKFLHEMLKNRTYICRVYILKGVGLTPMDDNDPSTYVKVSLNDRSFDSEDDPKDSFYPEYYHMFEFTDIELPGSAFIKIDVYNNSIFGDELIGSTSVDLEERIFNLKWVSMRKKPIEKRSLYLPGKGVRGRLEMWIDLIRPAFFTPAVPIFPKQKLQFELRVVVWITRNVVFKDELSGANDLYVRGKCKRGDDWKETDTHWRCRGTGSFNWRWKIPIALPIDPNKDYGMDRFVIQLWDRDLIGSNDLIGECEIDLNTHNMLKKAYSRKNKQVPMRRRVKDTGLETKKLWYDVFHSEAKDDNDEPISQGQVCLSFEVVPESLLEKYENEEGHSGLNFHPTLPQPVGRFSFDFLNPLGMLKEILGQKLYCQICTIFWLIIGITVFMYIGSFFFGGFINVAVSVVTRLIGTALSSASSVLN